MATVQINSDTQNYSTNGDNNTYVNTANITGDTAFTVQNNGTTIRNSGRIVGDYSAITGYSTAGGPTIYNYVGGVIGKATAYMLNMQSASSATNVFNYGTMTGDIGDLQNSVSISNYGQLTVGFVNQAFQSSSVTRTLTITQQTGASLSVAAVYGTNLVVNLVADDRTSGDPTIGNNAGSSGTFSGVNGGIGNSGFGNSGSSSVSVQSGTWTFSDGEARSYNNLAISQGAQFTVGSALTVASTALANAGTLTVSATITAPLGAGGSGSFLGNGTITGALALASGGSVTLTTSNGLKVGGFTGSSGAILNDVIGGQAFHVTAGTVNLAGMTLSLGAGGGPLAQGASQTIVDNQGSGAIQGSFVNAANGSTITVGGVDYRISYTGGDGNDVVITRVVPNSFSVADVSVTEGDTLSQTSQFVVTRSGGTAATSIAYTILDGGASNAGVAANGTDYSAPRSGTLNFAAGATSAVLQFQVIGDTLVEGDEQFRLVLGTPPAGDSVGRQIGYATIVDNDVPAGVPQQRGTPGDDTLIAQTAPSILIGGAGNDTYLVHSLGDVVIEQNGGGTDIVYTDVSYNLGSNEVEALSTSQQTGTANINLIGNFVSQTIVGNYGDNILNGGSGADTLIGLFGNDTYVVGDSRIIIQEQAGQGTDTVVTSVSYTLAAGVSVEQMVAQDRNAATGLTLTGNEVAQVIGGTNGADTINGGLGLDTLIGFGGADLFAFTTALGSSNVDTIADFSTADGDRIGLGASVFAGIGTTLDANEFVIGTAATGANAQIVYNQATGQLFYDADGTGAGAAILFTQIAPNTVLTTAAFTVV